MAAAKRIRRALVNGVEHTDASLAAMKTGEVATELVSECTVFEITCLHRKLVRVEQTRDVGHCCPTALHAAEQRQQVAAVHRRVMRLRERLRREQPVRQLARRAVRQRIPVLPSLERPLEEGPPTRLRLDEETVAHRARGLQVEFDDGVVGTIDLTGELTGPVFEPLRDEALFRMVTIDAYGAVCWPSGPDLAPDAMYREITKKRSPGHVS